MDIGLFVGQVVAIDPLSSDSKGTNIPVVHVKSFLDGAVIPIPWLPIGADQSMPMVGQLALYYRVGTHDSRIVCFHGTNQANIRKGIFGLNAGEACFQSDSGGGFLKVSADGSVSLVTGDAVTSLEGGDDGWQMKAPNIVLGTYGRCSLTLSEDGSIKLQKISSDGSVLANFEIDKDNNVNMVSTGNLSLKAKKILLDGEVLFGPGATDPKQSMMFGDVVTSGPFGTHPMDFVSGSPIPGSGSVKSAR